MVIAVMGLPGSGKSYFASRLAETLKAQYLSSDILRKQISSNPDYSASGKELVYESMLHQTIILLSEGKDVVMDATFYSSEIRKLFKSKIQPTGQKIFFMEVVADEELVRKRVSKPRPYSDADFAVYEKVRDSFEPMPEAHLILQSGENNIDEMILSAQKWLADELN